MACGRCSTIAAAGAASCLIACSVGEGKGWVRSDRLFIEDCWNGSFDLQPSFFGANAYREEQILIRIQRGNNIQELSDGLTILVVDNAPIREELLGTAVPVGLPPGVTPPGVPVEGNPNPPLVSLALYLHNTCHRDNGTIYSVRADQVDGGASSSEITFRSLFSGDTSEKNGDDRLTEAEFGAWFADPRDLDANGLVPADRASFVEGYLYFFFQRGQPAQPFP
ncbi:MAG: hypothetical protein JW751_05940 [Polyangiaceae bacterium]|nr:hypothetical protein [Polyangiaceae bacterium]